MFSEQTKKTIERQFLEFADRFPAVAAKLETAMASEEEPIRLLLQYLYANAPFSDVANYGYEAFRAFAAHGVLLRTHGLGAALPDRLFLDHVVYHRVNTEGISPCRQQFYEKLAPRIAGKTVEEAILETNYWCAEEATYQSTDDRTISAQAVWESGIGRCGEESVFTVNALRSVGIPARQVYAHRWAHCDDNHAWVEVWCDGSWHFLGACEPEEILDRGWFVHASSRAMMVNSRVYGNQVPDRDVISRTDMTCAMNQLSRYARTVTIQVLVTDGENRPVPGAKVAFSLLNYASLVPIAEGITDAAGMVSLETGKGSVFVSAQKDGTFGTVTADTRVDTKLVVALQEEAGQQAQDGQWIAFDMLAPLDAPVNTKKPTEAQRKLGEQKAAAAADKRRRKVSGFCRDHGVLEAARGNAAELLRFAAAETPAESLKQSLLAQLTCKDFRDCRADVLLEHLEEAAPWKDTVPEALFDAYVLRPRIDIEQQSAYRKAIKARFSKEEIRQFREQPQRIWDWICANVQEMPDQEYGELLTVPAGCLRYHIADSKSKRVLFVAMCRTFGIPARLDPVDGQMEYAPNGVFMAVDCAEYPNKTAEIRFRFAENVPWTYLQNWSVARYCPGTGAWNVLQLGALDLNRQTLRAAPGRYRILTTNRLPNGNQYAQRMEFCLHDGETREVLLQMRPAALQDMLEAIELEPFALQHGAGQTVPAEQLLRGESTLFLWLEVGKEPTEHILNELRENAVAFAGLSDRVHLILKHPQDLQDSTLKKTLEALPNLGIYYDAEPQNVQTLARRMYGDPDKLPLMLVVKPGLVGIYSASGYQVGAGDMLLRILNNQ